MKSSALLILAGLALALASAALPAHPVLAASTAAAPPPDFTLIDSAPGVDLYRKEYAGGTPDYVLVIDFEKGAGLTLLHGQVESSGADEGTFGGSNPAITRQPLQQFWDAFAGVRPEAVCVTNGTFFDAGADPAVLSLPLKVAGLLVSGGSWHDEYAGQTRMLEIWPDHARISNLTPDALAQSDAPEILGGLSEEAPLDPAALIGRTFAGVDDADGDGSAETVLLFSSKTTRTADAAAVLRSFGADDVIMLDGGDSAQMLCKGEPQVYSERTIPQAIGVTPGEQAAYAMRVKEQTDWAVVVQGDVLEIELELVNTGSETWRSGEVVLVNQRNDLGAGETLNLPADVPPEESVAFGWQTPPFDKTGVSLSQWDLMRGTQKINERPININIIVIPPELEDRKVELENQVREWARQQVDDMEARIMEWIQAQVRQGLERICPLAAVLPGAVVAGEVWKFRRGKRKK